MNDYDEFVEWKLKREKDMRERGAYWLTPEGREKLKDIFTDPEDGNAVRPLLDEVERLERDIDELLRK